MKTKLMFILASMLGAYIGGVLSWNSEYMMVRIISPILGGLVSGFVCDPKEAVKRLVNYWKNKHNQYLLKWRFLVFLLFVSNALTAITLFAPLSYFTEYYRMMISFGDRFVFIHIASWFAAGLTTLVGLSVLFGNGKRSNWTSIKENKEEGEENKKNIIYFLKYWNFVTAPLSILYYVVGIFLIKWILQFLVKEVFMSLIVLVYERKALAGFFCGFLGAALSFFFGNPIIWIAGGFFVGFIQQFLLGDNVVLWARKVRRNYNL